MNKVICNNCNADLTRKSELVGTEGFYWPIETLPNGTLRKMEGPGARVDLHFCVGCTNLMMNAIRIFPS